MLWELHDRLRGPVAPARSILIMHVASHQDTKGSPRLISAAMNLPVSPASDG